MDNPRFPHRLVVKRARTDEYGDMVTDMDGNVIYDVVRLSLVATFDGVPQKDANGQFITTEVEELSFGYRTDSQNTKVYGDVIVSDWKLATPMFLTPLNPGDLLELTDYDKSYKGKVVKKKTSNWGSNIWFNEIKN